jgi:hypothetical protein
MASAARYGSVPHDETSTTWWECCTCVTVNLLWHAAFGFRVLIALIDVVSALVSAPNALLGSPEGHASADVSFAWQPVMRMALGGALLLPLPPAADLAPAAPPAPPPPAALPPPPPCICGARWDWLVAAGRDLQVRLRARHSVFSRMANMRCIPMHARLAHGTLDRLVPGHSRDDMSTQHMTWFFAHLEAAEDLAENARVLVATCCHLVCLLLHATRNPCEQNSTQRGAPALPAGYCVHAQNDSAEVGSMGMQSRRACCMVAPMRRPRGRGANRRALQRRTESMPSAAIAFLLASSPKPLISIDLMCAGSTVVPSFEPRIFAKRSCGRLRFFASSAPCARQPESADALETGATQ